MARGVGESERTEDFGEAELDGLFETFREAAKSIYRRWPHYPGFADITAKTTESLPGYSVFNQLSPRDRYYLFICAMGTSARARLVDQAIEAAAKEMIAPPSPSPGDQK